MAGITNFIPEVWADMLLVDREQEAVLANLCYKGPFLGEIENKGSILHIAGLGRPTIRNYVKGEDMTAEYLQDSNVDLVIDQCKYFDVYLDDVDQKQANGKIMPTQMKQARLALVDAMETYLGGMYAQAGATVTNTQAKGTNIISTIASGMQKLMENNVPSNEAVNLVVNPAIAMKIALADILFNTANSAAMKNGWRGQLNSFMNCHVYCSNALTVNTSTGNVKAMLFTGQAIALAEQIPAGSIEKFRVEKRMADGIKGLHLYGAKVIKPKELVCLDLIPADETTV